MFDLDAELIRQPPNCSLTSADLETIGKRACQRFLFEDTPLNDAIVKLATEYPGISSEQIKRVVEYANQHTFNHLFEKQADKNVEFTIADPADVLRQVNASAQRPIVKVANEYAAAPPQEDHLDLLADFELARIFGMEERLGSTPESFKEVTAAIPGWALGAGAGALTGAGVGAARSSKGQRLEGALRGGAAGGAIGGISGLAAGGGPLGSPVGGVAGGVAGGLLGAQRTKEVARERKLDELVEKGASLEKLAEAVSIERVRAATTDSGGYPDAHPFGDLHQVRSNLQKLAEDGTAARGRNRYLTKEASDRMVHLAKQHLLNDGELGDLVMAMGHVSTADSVKLGMAQIIPMLEHHGWDIIDLRARLAQYEMEKTANQRVPNPDNPFIEAYGAFIKLADGQKVIDDALARTEGLLKEATQLVGKALQKESELAKAAGDMPPFTEQDRPEKVKDIYRALKRDHPDMPAEKKARIAARQGKKGKQKQGPPYKGPITKEGSDFEKYLGL